MVAFAVRVSFVGAPDAFVCVLVVCDDKSFFFRVEVRLT
jgi:hypothetical protein